MPNSQPPDYLPISMLNQIEYCERRFWYMFVEGEMEVNAPVADGIVKHKQVHAPGAGRRDELVATRSVYLRSDRLHIAGFADVIESAGGLPRPVEHKRGRTGRWINDRVQLCAQAMCIEERTGQDVTYGYLFYWASRRRQRIEIDQSLRQRTEATIARAFDLIESGRTPDPLDAWAKCQHCSLEPICMPREVMAINR